jgi:hypothetical protein
VKQHHEMLHEGLAHVFTCPFCGHRELLYTDGRSEFSEVISEAIPAEHRAIHTGTTSDALAIGSLEARPAREPGG